MALEKFCYKVRVIGRVQGVWFRGWAKHQANKYEISGWIRNRKDGSVEAVISGSEDNVQEMLGALKIGPPSAKVTSIHSTPCNPPYEGGFLQLVTA